MRLHLVVEVLGTLGAVAVLALSLYLVPDARGFGTHEGLGLPACGYLLRSGRPCLSCGLTTSFSNCVRGRLPSAWRANPAGLPLFFVTLLLPWWLVRSWWTKRDPFRFLDGRLTRWIPLFLLLALLVSWVARGGLG